MTCRLLVAREWKWQLPPCNAPKITGIPKSPYYVQLADSHFGKRKIIHIVLACRTATHVCTFLFFYWNIPPPSLCVALLFATWQRRTDLHGMLPPPPRCKCLSIIPAEYIARLQHRPWPQLLEQPSTQPDEAPKVNNSRVELGPPEGRHNAIP